MVQPFGSQDQKNRVVAGGAMGPLHPEEPKLREVEPHIEEADGKNRQRSQELLELATEEKD